jgi:hypothetical protein
MMRTLTLTAERTTSVDWWSSSLGEADLAADALEVSAAEVSPAPLPEDRRVTPSVFDPGLGDRPSSSTGDTLRSTSPCSTRRG